MFSIIRPYARKQADHRVRRWGAIVAGGGLIWWGVALIVIGVLVGATGGLGAGGLLTWLGWLLLIVGVILAIVHLASAREPRPAR